MGKTSYSDPLKTLKILRHIMRKLGIENMKFKDIEDRMGREKERATKPNDFVQMDRRTGTEKDSKQINTSYSCKV